MARRVRSPLDNRTSRLKLTPRKKIYTTQIGHGLHVGYRRTKTEGTWSGKFSDQHGNYYIRKLDGVVADDYRDNDPAAGVIDFWEASKRIRAMALGDDESTENSNKPLTIDAAIDLWKADLKARDNLPGNALWLKHRLPASLRRKVLALVTTREFRKLRDDLVESGEIERSSINRLMKSAKAAFNHAAKLDPRITNRLAWSEGLQALPAAEKSRNVVISREERGRIVAAAKAISPELGLFCEIGAVTGQRPSQIAKLQCSDALTDRLLMPSSKKGRGHREITRKPIPIAAGLAARLRDIAKGRSSDAPLLTMKSGEPWRTGGYRAGFRLAVEAVGLDSDTVTYYSFRHSHITDLLLRNVPVTLVADQCDTSPQMIKKNYAAFISNHGDEILRANMLDLAGPVAGDNVVKLTRGK